MASEFRVGILLAIVLGLGFVDSQSQVVAVGRPAVAQTVTGGLAQFEIGEDELICLGVRATIAGTMDADLLTGTNGPDVIAGRGGNDIIDGKGGDDILCGGSGDDFILGGPGDDFIRAWSGDDFVNSGPGRDTVLADDGDDYLVGEGSRDFLSGSGGNDIIFGGEYLFDEQGHGQFYGDDVMLGGQGNDIIIGGEGNDGILAFGGNDFLLGGRGDDFISGSSGDDYIDAGPGSNDRCDGGEGVDSAVNCESRSKIERRETRSFPFVRLGLINPMPRSDCYATSCSTNYP
jgi:Ca2+-binding RTX toxin-like protein